MSLRAFLKLAAAVLPLLILCSCDSDEGVQEYTQKKETPSAPSHVVSFTWVAPPAWKAQDSTSSIRLASYEVPGDGGSAECLVSVLDGSAGGILNNVNMWRQQMGLPPVDEPAMEKEAQKIEIANFPSVVVDLKGTYKGKNSEVKTENSRMLGVILPAQHRTFFIKMVGPEGTVEAQCENFKTFYRSFTAIVR